MRITAAPSPGSVDPARPDHLELILPWLGPTSTLLLVRWARALVENDELDDDIDAIRQELGIGNESWNRALRRLVAFRLVSEPSPGHVVVRRRIAPTTRQIACLPAHARALYLANQ